MNLRGSRVFLQLLFAATILLGHHGLRAQTAASIKLKSGAIVNGVITRTTPSGIEVQTVLAGSTQTVIQPFAQVAEVTMPAPPELAQALGLAANRQTDQALAVAMGIAGRYKGLPTDWAKQAMTLVGSLQLAKNDLTAAELAFNTLDATYPSAGEKPLPIQVGLARIAHAKGQKGEAKTQLQPVADKALAEKSPATENLAAYSQAFYTLGQIAEAEGKTQEALENYVRTVALFYHDPTALAGAKERAAKLRADAAKKKEILAVP